LCGGTHVNATGEIGGFRILSEESIAAGTRRIEAATGGGLEAFLDGKLAILHQASHLLKTTDEALISQIEQLQGQLKEYRRTLKKYQAGSAEKTAREIMERGECYQGDLKFYWGRVEDLPVEELRKMSDWIRSRADRPTGLVLLSVEGGRVHIVAAFDEAFQDKGIHAGKVCRSIGNSLGGGGGGKPGMAQGQGKNIEGADQALSEAVNEIREKMEKG
jgi:alanyl-tRNA synthetase